ncbi:MAG: ABC transporter ATP-binding protein/permease [Algoriphagus sp.]|uniref:ABC transporter ATP-binding protein n=2 Tax=Algoriphagus sp. TaxID=1872435 RepID=UPI0032982312
MYVLLALSLITGFLDGFGLAMFIPLVQVAGNEALDSSEVSESLGILKFLVDGITGAGFDLTPAVILTFLFLLFLLKGIIKYFEGYYKVLVQMYFVKKIRYQMVDDLGNMGYRSFLKLDAGRVQNTLSGEVYKIISAYVAYFATLQSIVLLLVYLILALLANFQFALLVSFGGYLTNFIYKMIYKRTTVASINNSNLSHVYQGLLIQAVHHFKYLKATDFFGKYKQKLKSYVDQIEDEQKKIGIFNAILQASREPLVIGIVILVILIQITVLNSNMAAIFLSLLFFYRALNYIMLVQTSWQAFTSNLGGLHVGVELLEDFRTGVEKNPGNIKVNQIQSIELADLTFGYDPSNPILKNINFKIENNRTYALVGKSGSGKTTLTNILAGLIEPSSGEFLVNSSQRDEVDLGSFRNRVGYITQEPVIFNDTIFNNVSFWSEPTPENKAKFDKAIKLAHLDELVESFPKKENTHLGDNGVLISGGQKQRISIARELFKEVDLLIFDEATSALDSETEKAIQNNIESLRGSCNIILIAHRLSTVKNADEILVMNEGIIEDSGEFSELMLKNVRFKNMVELQEF